jgi:hypothetical protein
LYLTSCTKTGPAGAQGPAGTNGNDGNANVFTDTLTVESTEWAYGTEWYIGVSQNGGSGVAAKYYDVPFDKITSGIIDSGMVSVFIAPYRGGQWLELPCWYDSNDFQINYVYLVTPGNVRLEIYLSPTTSTFTPDVSTYAPATYDFKIVAVAGTLPAGG